MTEPVNTGVSQDSSTASHGRWRLKRSQQLGIALLLIAILAQLVWAGLSIAGNEADRRQLINQETDISALTFTQRESFTVLQRIDRWVLEEATARDVQIARANLARRLSVITSSGAETAALTGESYRSALRGIDELIKVVDDVDGPQRRELWREFADQIDEFDRETRALSSTFQVFLDAQSRQSIQERVIAEVVYLGLLLLSVGLLGFVSVSISSDILGTYRRTSQRLAIEQERVKESRERLVMIASLERRSAEIVERIKNNASAPAVDSLIHNLLSDLLAQDNLQVVSDSGERKIELIHGDPRVSPDDRQAVLDRVQELYALLDTRDSSAASLLYQSTHDSLTGLANRASYTSALRERVEGSRRSESRVFVVALDIDRFGELNSALGFVAGDQLLQSVAERIKEVCPQDALCARVAADEFAVISVASSREEAQEVATLLHHAVTFSAMLDGRESPITCATAMVFVDDPESDPGNVVGDVGAALQLAKQQGEGSVLFFDPAVHKDLGLMWLDDRELQRALRDEEFVLHYQPIVTLPGGHIAGFEALLRWEKPGVGLVYPDSFLDGVNRAGMTLDLGRQIIEKALSAWSRSFSSLHPELPPYVAINVDPKQLSDSSFADFVLSVAARSGIPPSALVIEVTERDITEGQIAHEQLTRLRAGGVRIALDDFGTGYSNLSQLHKLPVDIVKLDRSFLETLETNYQSLGLMADIVQLAQRLNLVVVAEGIEGEKLRDLVTDIGVTHGQGYLYTAAQSEPDIMVWAARRHQELEGEGH